MTSPFKFLNAYDVGDKEIFFGRQKEIDALYQMVFETRLLLVYGASGTGKTSIIQCGLANRFRKTDWYQLFVRRKDDLNASLMREIRSKSGMPIAADASVVDAAQALYTDKLAPIYIIFDQFEELFILGSPEEQAAFFASIEALLESDVSCKIIIIMREEYLAALNDFERVVPALFDKRFRVEPMTSANIEQVITGTAAYHDIGLENGADTAKLIIKSLSDGKTAVQLAYLQVYLDTLYRRTEARPVVFTDALVAETGKLDDVMVDFLEDQTLAIQKALESGHPGIEPDAVKHMLEQFATFEGTKLPITRAELQKKLPGLFDVQGDKPAQAKAGQSDEAHQNRLKAALDAGLGELRSARILRDEDGVFELAHDSLARRIADGRSTEAKNLLKIQKLIRDRQQAHAETRTLLSNEEVDFIRPFAALLDPQSEEAGFLALSEAAVAQAEFDRLRRERNTRIVAVLMAVLFVVSAALGVWAMQKSQEASSQGARVLAFSSLAAQKEGNSSLALLLGIEALMRDTPDSEQYADSHAALTAGLLNSSELRTFKGHKGVVYSAVFSPDGRRAVTGSEDGTARVWDTATGKTIAVLKGHDAPVTSAAFSPDGRRVVTASFDSTARVWDAATGKLIATLKGHEAAVYRAEFSPDGRRIVTASADATARLWDAAKGAEIAKLEDDGEEYSARLSSFGGIVPASHYGEVSSAVFSPDGSRIVTASDDKTARLWDAATGQMVRTFKGHDQAVYRAEFSPDGRRIVTASNDGTARLWDAATGALQTVLTGHGDMITSAAFSPDGRRITTASMDQTARLWNAMTGALIAALEGHENAVYSAAFSPDGRRIVTASWDGTARLWDGVSGTPLATLLGHESALNSAVFAPDGSRIITGSDDQTARLWDAATGARLFTLKGHTALVYRAIYAPDGRRILTASQDGTARLWDAANGADIAVLKGHTDEVISAVYSPDGRRILTASRDKTARLWDARSGAAIAVLKGHLLNLYRAEFSPDGRRIATASQDGTARLWDGETGAWQATLKGHEGGVVRAEFSPDGSRIVTASEDKTARLWNAATGAWQATLKGHDDGVTSALFSPDGRRIVTASKDESARLWDAVTGKRLAKLKGHKAAVTRAIFSPDGLRIVTASQDKTARLWDAATGKVIAALKGHTDVIYNPVYSPDGRRIVTASVDGTARLWDAATGTALATLEGHQGHVTSARFSPDGRRIVTASQDGTAIVWGPFPVATDAALLAEACRRKPRELTEDERRTFSLAEAMSEHCATPDTSWFGWLRSALLSIGNAF